MPKYIQVNNDFLLLLKKYEKKNIYNNNINKLRESLNFHRCSNHTIYH